MRLRWIITCPLGHRAGHRAARFGTGTAADMGEHMSAPECRCATRSRREPRLRRAFDAPGRREVTRSLEFDPATGRPLEPLVPPSDWGVAGSRPPSPGSAYRWAAYERYKGAGAWALRVVGGSRAGPCARTATTARHDGAPAGRAPARPRRHRISRDSISRDSLDICRRIEGRHVSGGAAARAMGGPALSGRSARSRRGGGERRAPPCCCCCRCSFWSSG